MAQTLKARRRAHTPALRNFSVGVVTLAEIAPRHLTLAQASFFLAAAMADRAGKPATFTELQEAVGPAINRSLHTTYRVFLNEGRIRNGKRQDGLGWLRRETDPSDNRRKWIKLTPLGQSVADEIGQALALED
jgi:hypothetical protein